MPSLLITMGLGDTGDGSKSGMLITQGLGSPGAPDVAACHALRLYAIEPTPTLLTVIFSNVIDPGPATLDPKNWVITPTTGTPVKVSAVAVEDHRVFLTVNEQTIGAIYTLTTPTGSDLIDQFGNPMGGSNQMNFTGTGITPMFGFARALDARRLEVIFSEAMQAAAASNPANYEITPPIAVKSVKIIAPSVVELTTAKMAFGVTYTVALHNMKDPADNPMDEDT